MDGVGGTIVQAGCIGGGVHLHFEGRSAAVAHARYDQIVRQFVPAGGVVDRRGELRRLTDFARGYGRSDYLVLVAPPWAGKSALVAAFVLTPLPGVEVFSFFATARYGGMDNRAACLAVLVWQLSEFLGRPPVPGPSPHTGEVVLRGLLADAAARCAGMGRRLVLVVDGLDEDRGVSTGGEVHSIAAMLPAVLSPGMRVIVTTRPGPAIPCDVPDGHPLRGRDVVEELRASHSAQVVRHDMERELGRLVDGTAAERGLLACAVVAGGALTAADFAELTGSTEQGVRRVFDGVAGRTFVPARLKWGDGVAYLLGHEDLRRRAAELLDRAELVEYRNRLGAWASAHADRGWPETTPEYLLEGYPRLLVDEARVPELVVLATDPARHDRIRALTRSDVAAIGEIRDARESVFAGRAPDLATGVRLAVHLEMLRARNRDTPVGLPALLVALGHGASADLLLPGTRTARERAEARVRMIAATLDGAADSDVGEPVAALVSGTASGMGPYERADLLGRLGLAFGRHGRIGEAVDSLALIPERAWRLDRQRRLVHELARRGHGEAAARVAALVDEQVVRADARVLLIALDDPPRAMEAVLGTPLGPRRIVLLAAVADIAATAGRVDDRVRMVRVLEREAEATDPAARAALHNAVAVLHAAAAEIAPAVAALDRVRAALRSVRDPFTLAEAASAMARALSLLPGGVDVDGFLSVVEDVRAQVPLDEDLVDAVVRLGGVGRALKLAPPDNELPVQFDHLVAVAHAAHRVGRDTDVRRLLESMDERVRATTNPLLAPALLGCVAAHRAARGEVDTALAVLERIDDPAVREQHVVELAVGLARQGRVDRAVAVAVGAGSRAVAVVEFAARAVALAPPGTLHVVVAAVAEHVRAAGQHALVLVRALVGIGEYDHAETVVRVPARGRHPTAVAVTGLAVIARVAGAHGHHDRAARLAARAHDLLGAAGVDGGPVLDSALAELAFALATVEPGSAAEVAATIVEPDIRAQVLTLLDRADGGPARACFLVDPDLDVLDLRALVDTGAEAEPLNRLEDALARDDLRLGEAVVEQLADPVAQAEALVRLAARARTLGDTARALHFIDRGESLALRAFDPGVRLHVLRVVAAAAVRSGSLSRACRIARRVDDSRDRTALLVAIAECVDHDQRAPLFADALREGCLEVVMGALQVFDPAVLPAFEEEFTKLVPGMHFL
ncbi:hypothetical protein L6E12_11125 [Actinokineospora sp. PR83]|uniref:hypothetical protein n=1 Tax=Actinokineospora sp. PR83 TaxID=2884908 RepID=UPI001F204983|nr:hypothetical protein [Actinokineospora sp. PR83]MCG8916342.1 hypothetical protein [Actinokineospora sp. PR83]